MNRDDIIRMAREAIVGYPDCDPEDIPPLEGDELGVFERFAALVIANHPPQSFMSWQEGYAAGVAAEREACAKVADKYMERWTADAIRARGETK